MVHAKSDSDATLSIEASTPPHSPRRPLYFVQSPPHELEKMSYLSAGSSPGPYGSPTQQYHCSPIHHHHHSRESSRYSATLNKINPRYSNGWRRMQAKYNEVDDDGVGSEGDHEDGDGNGEQLRFYVLCFVLGFVVLFGCFSFILWASSLSYKPEIVVKSIVFEKFNVQAGMDYTGVPTDMLTLNSTVRIFYRNPATFFGVHVTSTPILLHYFDLKLASGHMTEFYQSRKSQRTVITQVQGHQVPMYGGIPLVTAAKGHPESMSVPLNLTFVMRSRANILGKLVSPKFYRTVSCHVTLGGNHLGKTLNFTKMHSCVYR